MIWFTSDTHAYHANIIRYSKRPWKTADEMSLALAEKINSVVAAGDILVHAGDFAWTGKVEQFRSMINCRNIFFVYGNHDREIRKDKKLQSLFVKCTELYELKHPDITVCHYAMRVWNKSHHGAIHLYGHSHGLLPDDPNSRSIDIGVDTCLFGHERFMPYCMDEIDSIMHKHKNWKPIDHHTGAH